MPSTVKWEFAFKTDYKLGFRAHYVRTNPLIVLHRFFKSGRPARSSARRVGEKQRFFLGTFSLRLFRQRKSG